MVKSELVKRSPLRIFEKSIHGGLGAGNLGVLASRKGVGKTACLVHIATDQLFRDKHVIHVSFSAKVDHIISWYEDIFKEIAKKRELESAVEVHDEIIKNRVIMNFNQQGIDTDQILKSLNAMISDGNFAADTIIFDGYDFEQISIDDLAEIKKFAEESGGHASNARSQNAAGRTGSVTALSQRVLVTPFCGHSPRSGQVEHLGLTGVHTSFPYITNKALISIQYFFGNTAVRSFSDSSGVDVVIQPSRLEIR